MGKFKARYLGQKYEPGLHTFQIMNTDEEIPPEIDVRFDSEEIDGGLLNQNAKVGDIIEMSHPKIPDYPPFKTSPTK